MQGNNKHSLQAEGTDRADWSVGKATDSHSGETWFELLAKLSPI
jgi:hypothetical protein